MQLISPVFQYGETIPKKYTQFGENISPPLEFHDIPREAKSLVLLMDDPDVPPQAGVPVWDHWVLYNIPASQTKIPEGASGIGQLGKTTTGEMAYAGPRPPDREHRYFFKLFALDSILSFPESPTKQDVLHAMKGHVIEEAELMGRFAPL